MHPSSPAIVVVAVPRGYGFRHVVYVYDNRGGDFAPHVERDDALAAIRGLQMGGVSRSDTRAPRGVRVGRNRAGYHAGRILARIGQADVVWIRFRAEVRTTDLQRVEIRLSGIGLADSRLETVKIRFEIRRLIDGALGSLRGRIDAGGQRIRRGLQTRLGGVHRIGLSLGLVVLGQVQSHGVGGLLRLRCSCDGTIGGSLSLGHFSGNTLGSGLQIRLCGIESISLRFRLIVLAQVHGNAISGLLGLGSGSHRTIRRGFHRFDVRGDRLGGLGQARLGRIGGGNIDLQLVHIALCLVRTGLCGIGCVLRCGCIVCRGIGRRLGLTGCSVRSISRCLCIVSGCLRLRCIGERLGDIAILVQLPGIGLAIIGTESIGLACCLIVIEIAGMLLLLSIGRPVGCRLIGQSRNTGAAPRFDGIIRDVLKSGQSVLGGIGLRN